MKKFLVVVNAYPEDGLIDARSAGMEKLIRQRGIEGLESIRVGRSVKMIIRCDSLDTLIERVEKMVPALVDEVLENYEVEIEELADE